jgi:nitroreductase
MEKPAEVAHPVHELLRRRWSPLAYAERAVEPEKLQSLFEAARWAPSCFNEQPWNFIVCAKDSPADHERLVSCLAEGNVPWARTAPVLMLSVARRTFARNGNPNRHALHDVGLAVENFVIQGMALGLFVHQMAGFDAAKARTLFGIPEDHEPVAAIAIGYPGDPDQLPPPLRERQAAPRQRKPQEQFVFGGSWGQPAPALARRG